MMALRIDIHCDMGQKILVTQYLALAGISENSLGVVSCVASLLTSTFVAVTQLSVTVKNS